MQQTARMKKKKNSFLYSFYGYKKYFPLVVMFLPAIIYFFVFKYVPMYGIVLAFKDYNISKGIMGSEWVGLEHFEKLMRTSTFTRSVRNTIIISFGKIIFGFPAPIILALFLNEVRNLKFKKVVQTKLYPLSRTFSNLSTLIFRRDFSGVPHLIDMLFLQIQQSGRIGYKYP